MSPRGWISYNMRLELEAIATDPDEEHLLEGTFEELHKLLPMIEHLACLFSE